MAKKKKTSKMSAKARMAYVRSFIGKKRGKKGGSLASTMEYVRSFKHKGGSLKSTMDYVNSFKHKSGGRFPKGKPSEWRKKAKSGSAKERAVFKRALDNWNKLMSKAGFKEKWNANKKVKGGSLESNVNYSQLINMYQNRNFGMGYGGGAIPCAGASCGGAIRAGAIRAAGIRAGAIRAAGLLGRKNFRGGMLTPRAVRKIDKVFNRRLRGGAITKKDLYRGGARFNSLFMNRDRMKRKSKKIPMSITPPDDEMVRLYRNLYARSGIHPENMIDPIVRNDRLRGGNILRKAWNAVPVVVGKAANGVSKILGTGGRLRRRRHRRHRRRHGGGLIEEAGLNGRGHPDYIYH